MATKDAEPAEKHVPIPTKEPEARPERIVLDAPSQHAFVMTGKNTLFLCHLTMFHMEEHMYQVVLRARLPDYAMRAYLEDSARHPEETYFLGNVADDLMTNPDIGSGARESFVADVYRGIPDRPVSDGWPWTGMEKVAPVICANVSCAIERVVHYRHFDTNWNRPDTLTYLLFGSGDEAHLYHQQTKDPDFDSVVSLKSAPGWLAPRLLEAGVPINFPSLPSLPDDGPVYCDNPVKNGVHRVQYGGTRTAMDYEMGYMEACGGDEAEAKAKAKARAEKANAGYRIDVGRTLWFNTKLPNMMDPCKGKGSGGGG